MFSENAKEPGTIISDFRKGPQRSPGKTSTESCSSDGDVLPGDEQLWKRGYAENKQGLIGEIIGLLQSPAKNVNKAAWTLATN